MLPVGRVARQRDHAGAFADQGVLEGETASIRSSIIVSPRLRAR
jgi:hypothetical protein